MMRIGLGYDRHCLVEGRALLIGGIEIPFIKGEAGHSDGDVLLHAVTDAVLGAAGLGDIGEFFPPSEVRWKDADSSILLSSAWHTVVEQGWYLENIDCVVALEKPKFLPYRQHVRAHIAELLNAEPEAVFVKAKTGEGIGAVGRSEAVEAWCVCLLSR